MRPLLLGLLFLIAGHAIAVEPLTDVEKSRLAELQAQAARTPALRDATDEFQAARKAYQLDRRKFPADRNPQVARSYRKAVTVYEFAVRSAMLEPLLERRGELIKLGLLRANEGETVADSDSPRNLAIKPIEDRPGLPRVLLIGDSISIGYTLGVRQKLEGKANVHRIPVNGGATEVGLENLDSWLGDGRWDVIHFNFGLHDAKYSSATTQRTSRDEYAANLRTLVERMQATGARLVFATTTPVPNGGLLSPTRKFDSIPERNQVAIQVMQEANVAIDDLYAVVLPVQEKVGRSNDVHYQPEGYEILATAVAASIEAELSKL